MLRNEEAAIKAAMSTTAENITFRLLKTFEMPKPVLKVVHHERKPDEVEHVLDAEGKPMYEMEEFAEFETFCGNVANKHHARVKDLINFNPAIDATQFEGRVARTIAGMFLQQYEQMKTGKQEPIPDGHLPIDKWPMANPTVIAALKYARIFTVQQLAQSSEAALARIPPGLQPTRIRADARNWLSNEQAAAVPKMMESQQSELTELRAELAVRDAQMTEMRGMLEKLLSAQLCDKAGEMATDAKKSGRKPMPRDENGEIVRSTEAA